MNQQNIICCDDGRTVGIVSAKLQQIANIYPAQTAILRGTLYPDLDKPMSCAAAPSGCTAPSAAQTMAFSAWEVRLYLNTHPNDMAALQLYEQMCRQMPEPGYACAFVSCKANRWSWVDEPWPWECEAN